MVGYIVYFWPKRLAASSIFESTCCHSIFILKPIDLKGLVTFTLRSNMSALDTVELALI